ncbi:translation termination factor eRF1, partial [Coemansia aciculifera]
KEKEVSIHFEPFKPINTSLYLCSNKFYVKVLQNLLDNDSSFDQDISLSQESLSNVRLVHETKLIEKLFEEILLDTGKYVYGVLDTLRALEMGAVETLIVWESLDVNRVVLNNPDGTTADRFLTPAQEADRSNFVDNETGAKLEVNESMFMLEWLTEIYKERGAILEFVTDRSAVGSQFVKDFGGIGALLRYKAGASLVDDEDK